MTSNILHFPKSYSVGWVKIPETTRPDPYNNWKLIADATGKVSVPANVPIRLIVDSFAGSDLTWLNAIGATQLTQLYLVQTNVTDTSMPNVSHLTGLEVLTTSHTYENISDAGLIHIKPLINLRKLFINATNIGDIGLSYLNEMKKLEELSIGATNVTDAGLKYLFGLSNIKEISFDTAYSARKNLITEQGISFLRKDLPNCVVSLND